MRTIGDRTTLSREELHLILRRIMLELGKDKVDLDVRLALSKAVYEWAGVKT